MSVYNGEGHLCEAVDSILSQTLTDFEFILVNDGSTDRTPDLLEQYVQYDERIRLLHNPQNLGLTRSLNRGLSLAQGEYLARLDADDIALPHRLETQVDFLDKHREIGAIGAGHEVIDEEGQTLGRQRPPAGHEAIMARLLLDNCLAHSTLMVRRDLIQKLGGYDESLRYSQDYDLWWRLSRCTELAAVSETLVKWRYTGTNISGSHRRKQLQCAYWVSLGAVRESLNGQQLDEEAYRWFWWSYQGRYDIQMQNGILRLGPFWQLVENHPGGPRVLGPRLHRAACNLLRYSQLHEGYRLLQVVTRQLQQPIEWEPVLKSVFKGVLRPFVPMQAYRRWQQLFSG